MRELIVNISKIAFRESIILMIEGITTTLMINLHLINYSVIKLMFSKEYSSGISSFKNILL